MYTYLTFKYLGCSVIPEIWRATPPNPQHLLVYGGGPCIISIVATAALFSCFHIVSVIGYNEEMINHYVKTKTKCRSFSHCQVQLHKELE